MLTDLWLTKLSFCINLPTYEDKSSQDSLNVAFSVQLISYVHCFLFLSLLMSRAFILFILKRQIKITFEGAAMLTPAVLFVSFFLN